MAAGTAKTMISAEIGNAFLCTCVRVCVIAFEWACFCESIEVVFDVHGCSWFRPCSALPVRWLLQRIRLRLLQKSSAQFLLPVSGEAFPYYYQCVNRRVVYGRCAVNQCVTMSGSCGKSEEILMSTFSLGGLNK